MTIRPIHSTLLFSFYSYFPDRLFSPRPFYHFHSGVFSSPTAYQVHTHTHAHARANLHAIIMCGIIFRPDVTYKFKKWRRNGVFRGLAFPGIFLSFLPFVPGSRGRALAAGVGARC